MGPLKMGDIRVGMLTRGRVKCFTILGSRQDSERNQEKERKELEEER